MNMHYKQGLLIPEQGVTDTNPLFDRTTVPRVQSCREKLDKPQRSPSIDNTAEQKDRRPGLQEQTSVGLTPKLTVGGEQRVALHSGTRLIETPSVRQQEPPRPGSRQVLPPHGNNRKLYASVVAATAETKHKALVRSKINQTPEMIKNQLKSKVNPTEIKVGITSLKMLRDGRLMIEASSKQEIEALGNKIEETCGAELEVSIQKRRNPRMVLLGIPEDITTDNIETTLAKQNPELDIKEGDIRAKFSYTTKRETKNLVIEVDSGTRKKLIQTRIKLGWTICRADDYIVAKRCFRCSRFNHNFRDCRGEETCPLCTGSHKLRDCTATKSEYKCINCLTYNRHHQTTQIDTAHSSLDKSCPSLMAVIEKYKRNTDY